MDHSRDYPPGVPPLGTVDFPMIGEALRLGWCDLRRAPGYAMIFSGAYVVSGWAMLWITQVTGQTYWLIFAAVGFPLIGPFAAVGFYEVSHRLNHGWPLTRAAIFGVILHQSRRQLPSICVIIIMVFLFWFFLAHMIFALFLGLSTMTNISTSYEVFLTQEGLSMLIVGGAVGAGFALLLYAITVVSLPMLLDREVDFVSAMIASVSVVTGNPAVMLTWGLFIAILTFVAMLPAFLGLFLALPVLGHATWHLYVLIKKAGEAGPPG